MRYTGEVEYWIFKLKDSDYDVRFIYIENSDCYMQIDVSLKDT